MKCLDIMEIKKNIVDKKKTVQGYFSQEFILDKRELATFLRHLADQVESEDNLKIRTDEWVLPFPHASHAKVDIDLEDDELEIEIEFKKRTGKLYANPIDENKKGADEGSKVEEKEEHDKTSTGHFSDV